MRTVRFGDVPWEPRTEDEWPCLVKRQLIDEELDVTVRTVWYARDAVEPRHVHDGTHAAVILLGSAVVDGQRLGPWDVVYGPGGQPHAPLHYPTGCMLFAMLSGSAFHTAVGTDASVTDAGPAPEPILERDRPWTSPPPAGDGWACERKALVADRSRGYTSALLRWPAGAVHSFRELDGALTAVILSGRATVGGEILGPWDLLYTRGREPHPPIDFPDGCTVALSATGSTGLDLASAEVDSPSGMDIRDLR